MAVTHEQRVEFFALLVVALVLVIAGLVLPFPPLTAIGVAVVVYAVVQAHLRERRARN